MIQALRFGMLVLGHVLKHVPRHVLRHVPEHVLARHVLDLTKKLSTFLFMLKLFSLFFRTACAIR